MAKKNKPKNYRVRQVVWRVSGFVVIAVAIIVSLVIYEFLVVKDQVGNEQSIMQIITAMKDGFKDYNANFIIEDTSKLNMLYALPILTGVLVFLFVILKKNKEFFKDKIALGMIIFTTVLYLLYSMIGMFLAVMIGATVGVFFDEFVFMPLSKSNKKKSEFKKELCQEREKERVRQEVRNELDGSV